MKTKLHVVFMLLLFYSFMPHAFATDYYTASANATLAGNTGVVNANWTTNPDGITGLTSVTITATDNLIILNGGTATITAGMTISSLTIHAGGRIIHNNNATASSFNINGLLTWNGTIKTLQAASGSNFFSVNGDVIGNTALHDIGSTRSVYLSGDGLRTVNLNQVAGGIIASGAAGIQVTKNRKLTGNCIWYSPLIFGGGPTPATVLDLNGYDLQVSSIQAGSTTRLLKCNSNSSLSISGGQQATNLFLDPSASTLKKLTIDLSMNPAGVTTTATVNITGNLTTSTLYFGVASGGTLVRTPQLTGNFTLADNGSMRIQSKGANDQLKVIGNITIGSATTLQFDLINSYAPPVGAQFDFATATGTITGTFASLVDPNKYTGKINYPAGKIQYEIVTGPPPAPACSMSLNPDLPLVPSNATIDSEIESIVKRFSDNFLGTAEPTATALNTAIASYNALGITVNGYNISSTTAVTSYEQVSFIKTFAQYLKFHPEDTDNIYTKALNTVWLLSDRMCKGAITVDGNGYSFRNFGWSSILIPRIKDNSYVKSLFENLLNQQNVFDYLWEPDQKSATLGYNIDHMGNMATVTMAYVKWIDSADERYRYMTAFKRMMGKYIRYSEGTLDGIKPDGAGFHHWASYPSYTGYDVNPAADITYYLRQTSFQVSTETYLLLRDAIMAQLMFGNDKTTRSIAMGGRKPQEFNTVLNRFSFRNMAVAGGSIMGTGASDPVMATFHNRIWGGYAPFGNSTVAPFNEGYFQFNHSMAGIYRKDGWVATCKGFTNNMFGTETFGPIAGTSNRFGRYQSYGAVDIVYAGDNLTENGYDVTTRDWNFVPGTTVIRLPWEKLHAERETQDELQQKRFVGSLSFINKNGDYLKAIQGTYGMFAMDFQERTGNGWGATYGPESHNATFTFKKSVFTFDNMLICLGSGIGNNDTANTTLTTLYQRKAVAGKEQVNVDNNLLSTGSYDNSYDDTANHWIIDNFNTGFYVFAGSGTIKLTKADQQTPQHDQLWSAQNIANNPVGNYAIGYIDHGTAPSNKGYEYVCMPKATAADMTTLGSQIDAGNKPYTVHRKDEMAHIVEYKPTATANSIFGYAFFSALSGVNNSGQLTGADYPCLVMSQYDKAQKSLKLAVNNPDLGFTWRQATPSVDKQINITIKGTNWQISQPNSRASITGTANGETTIQFTVVDGLPVEITLSRVLTPQTITFDALPTKIANDVAFDLTATASSNLPVTYTSSNTEVATVSGSTVTIVGKGTSTITAKQDGDDIYGAAEAVEQTLTVNPATQTITFDAIPTKAIGDTAFDLTATASSNLPVTYTSSNTDVATISGSTVTIVGKGNTTITASQEGNTIYDVATAVEQILRVNTEPTVAIASPLANASYNAPATITITADAADVDGSISKVEFFEGTNKLGEATAAPYTFDWNDAAAGSYAISVKATDNDGTVTTSEIVNVTVNELPTVSITSPSANASYSNPATITITADATDTDGSVSKVEFFEGTNKLGEATTAPYSFDWTNVASGSYALTAKVTDNNDAVVTSEIVNATVNALPTVAITSPVNNASYNALANIIITADAADADGSVSKVEFFNGSTKLGEDLSAPYSFNWNNVASGSYVLTAKVTDNNGAVTTSTVVSVIVVCPTVQLSIPDVYAMNPAIDDVNTIYLGYGPTSVTLNSLVQGDQDVAYTWSTGAHTPSISVSQAGTYTVTASYAGGCQSTASIAIDVLDVRCGNDNTKVQICHNNTIICVAQSAVQTHLNHGDKLGSCSGTSKMAAKEEVTTSSNFTVYPNPVQDSFNVSVSSKLDPNATIGIYNMLGNKIRQVRFTAVPQNVFIGDLPSGNYIVVVQNGVETFRSTIVKQ